MKTRLRSCLIHIHLALKRRNRPPFFIAKVRIKVHMYGVYFFQVKYCTYTINQYCLWLNCLLFSRKQRDLKIIKYFQSTVVYYQMSPNQS